MIDPSFPNAGYSYPHVRRSSGGDVPRGTLAFLHAPEIVPAEWRLALAAFRQRQRIRRLLGFPVGPQWTKEPDWVWRVHEEQVAAFGSGNGRTE